MAIIPCNQLSLADVFSECQDTYESDKPEFLGRLTHPSIQKHFKALF